MSPHERGAYLYGLCPDALLADEMNAMVSEENIVGKMRNWKMETEGKVLCLFGDYYLAGKPRHIEAFIFACFLNPVKLRRASPPFGRPQSISNVDFLNGLC